jgi:glycosyltransferase involved in cell wall biosynthesis
MPQGIKYYSFYEKSGYADSANAYLTALSALGIPVSWHPLLAGKSGHYEPLLSAPADLIDQPALQSLFHADVPYDVVILHVIPEYYERCLVHETGKFIVAYSTWETDTLPASWLPLLALADLILVPCQWNRAVYERGGCRVPIRVVPHIFNPPRSTPIPLNLHGVRPTDFVFYSIGVWTSRKNNERLIEAFLRAFTARDPVVLVLKTTREDERLRRRGKLQSVLSRWFRTSRRAVRRLRRNHAAPARVILLDAPVSSAHIEALHQRGDAYVSLAHAEGWGLGAFDAAGRDKPVMMTGYGGPLDFLPRHLAHLIDYDLVPVDVGPMENRLTYRQDHRWAQPRLDHAVQTFKQIYVQRLTQAATGRALGSFVRTHFTSNENRPRTPRHHRQHPVPTFFPILLLATTTRLFHGRDNASRQAPDQPNAPLH